MTGKWAVVPGATGVWMRCIRVARVCQRYAHDRHDNIYLLSSVVRTFDDYPAARKHAAALNERVKP